jgi:hypothetical protein
MQTHWPAWQLVPEEHECPHMPQLLGSVCVFVHVDAQRFGTVAPHMEAQADPEQSGAAPEQLMPHAPQFPFCARLSGQPWPASAQSANPDAHV